MSWKATWKKNWVKKRKLILINYKVNIDSMALPFLKKKEIVAPTTRMVPTERVKELASKGFSEPETIDILRKEGYNPEEIDRALTDVLKSSVAPSKPEEKSTLPTLEELVPKKEEKPEVPETSLPQEYYEYPIEDYLDALIQARVSDVDEKMKEFSMKYEEIEKKISGLNEQLSELTQARTEEQQQIIKRIDNFGDIMNEMSMRLANLEKAFKEALPALIESVRALSDIVHKFRSV